MNKSPVAVSIKGLLHGFSALYGLFTAGFLLVFAMSFILSGVLQLAVMLVGLVGFLAFCILGVILNIRDKDTFKVKEEHYLTIRLEGAMTPDGIITTKVSQLDKPRQYPQINDTKGRTGEGQ